MAPRSISRDTRWRHQQSETRLHLEHVRGPRSHPQRLMGNLVSLRERRRVFDGRQRFRSGLWSAEFTVRHHLHPVRRWPSCRWIGVRQGIRRRHYGCQWKDWVQFDTRWPQQWRGRRLARGYNDGASRASHEPQAGPLSHRRSQSITAWLRSRSRSWAWISRRPGSASKSTGHCSDSTIPIRAR
jgi:hypothetical protein